MKDIVESYGINPSLIFGLERILNELQKREDYYAKIGNTTIHYLGTSEDNIQVFQIQRKTKED